ncbi:MAG: PLP-dependent aminotransferase family protein [Flavobacteriaceae bacterium]|jgi:GntR family transcriptional regulator/MocR family aminotransferase|nr:PLP-dependent aminotransferase family protein [Flavobacteriaceae bacterium]
MSSPVKTPFNSLIKIDRHSTTAIYMQIANQLSNAIQRKYIAPQTKLPGTRALSVILQVNRNTIVAVYDELNEQGWIETVPNKGTFVVDKTQDTKNKLSSKDLYTYPKYAGYSITKNMVLDNPYEHSHCNLNFNDGTPDSRLTHINQLSAFYSANLKRKSNRKKLGYTPTENNDYFKTQLANYLNISRSLQITKQNILITRSTEMGIYIASQVALSPGDKVIVTELSYFSSNMAFQKVGAKLLTVPSDQDGIDVNKVEELCQKQDIRLLYLTPQHHYPTTVTLSAQRRIKLLQLAQKYGFIIIEDDYDYDFHYEKSSMLPLASVDTSGMVIYVGSFGKSLAPGFRTGFVVAPTNVIEEMSKYLHLIDNQSDLVMEQVLGELIEEGEIERYRKKSLKIYKERLKLFSHYLESSFNSSITFEKPTGGLALWVKWKQPINLMQLKINCAKEDLFIPKTLLYQNKELTAMRLGFGHLNVEEMEQSIDILYRNINKL